MGERDGRGGRRKGAGRPRGRRQGAQIQAYVTPEQAAWVRQAAEKQNTSISAIIGALIDEKMPGPDE